MKTLIAIAFGLAVLLSWSATPAEAAPSGIKRAWIWGPPGCVRVWSRRSRETRYAGAPRCRRIYV